MQRKSDNRGVGAFNGYSARRLLSGIVSARVLVLGALVTALAVSVGLALSHGTAEVRAQDAVMLHDATITVERSPNSGHVCGYSNFRGKIDGRIEVESIFGSIDVANFEHGGTQYKIQSLLINTHQDGLILQIDPLFDDPSDVRPSVTIGDETYPGQYSVQRKEHYIWLGVDLDWQVDDSIPFTLSLLLEESTETDPQSSADVEMAEMIGGTTGSDGGEEIEDEGDGNGFPGCAGWLAGVGVVVVASIGYAGYRFLR
jgi:hypothetical protein